MRCRSTRALVGVAFLAGLSARVAGAADQPPRKPLGIDERNAVLDCLFENRARLHSFRERAPEKHSPFRFDDGNLGRKKIANRLRHHLGTMSVVLDDHRKVLLQISMFAVVVNRVLNQRVRLKVGRLFREYKFFDDRFLAQHISETNAGR